MVQHGRFPERYPMSARSGLWSRVPVRLNVRFREANSQPECWVNIKPEAATSKAVFFSWKIAQIFRVTSVLSDDGMHRTYKVEGQVFFASVEDFNKAFDFKEVLEKVTIDVSHAHIWDISSVAALDMIVLKFRREGADVEIVGMNEARASHRSPSEV